MGWLSDVVNVKNKSPGAGGGAPGGIPMPKTHGDASYQLSHPISNTYSSVTGDKSSGFAKGITSSEGLFHPLGNLESQMLNGKGPEAPPEDSNLTKTLAAQQANAKAFRAGIPGMEQSLQNEVGQQGAQQLKGSLRGVRESNSSRGLLYGGLNQGQEQGQRASMSSALGRARAGINANVENQADVMDAQVGNTAMGVQKNRQQIQDSLYSQAMAELNSQQMGFGAGVGAGMSWLGTKGGG